ncbi:hypothetical protein [Eisenbergiella porci]|uniref:hypothetical protein n=1 Tax=Eisenbergiella porci TaxID=2652274 RepID=UPI002A7FC936|nr:hypothetical protein [Eisenbergiella porci]
MNRIKRNGYQKILSLTLSASLLLGLTGCGVQKAEETAATASEEEALLTEALSSQGAPSHSAETGKEETVYVLADASGGVEKIIVSDWLKNKDGDSTLQDASDLQNIENVKGYETFVSDGKNGLTWQADGADIYYQGSTEKQLPVAVKLTYKLDGKEVKPEEIAGKSGRVTIRMDYENKETRTVEVNGRKEEIHIPFAMLSGMLLPQDTFSNIEVTNGRLLSEGNNSIVVGIAFPGLKESLNWEELKKDLSKAEKKQAEEELAIPDYLEVSADAENFSLGMTMTIAMSDMLSDFSLTDSLDLEEMNDSMNDLQSASNELKDGTSDLKDGSAKLKEGTDSLADGVVSLKDGAGSLKEGTGELFEKSGELDEGASSLAEGADKLNSGASSLSDGAGSLKDGTHSLVEGTGSLVDGAEKLDAGAGALQEGIAGVNNGISALKTAMETGSGDQPPILGSSEAIAQNMGTLYEKVIAYFDTYEKDLAPVIQMIEEQMSHANGALETAQANLDAARSRCSQAQADLDNACQPSTEEVEVVTGRSVESVSGNDIVSVDTQTKEVATISADAVSGAVESYREAVREEAVYEAQVSAYSEQLNQLEEVYQVVQGLSSDAVQKATDIVTIKQYCAQLSAGTQALYAGLGQVDGGLTQLADQEKGVPALVAGANALKEGTAGAVSGARELNEGAKKLDSGAGTLKGGLDELKNGAATLSAGSGTLKTGTTQLKEGTARLVEGTGKLDEGALTLTDGVDTLENGAHSLQEGALALDEGAGTLKDGMFRFDEEGISKLADIFGDNTKTVTDRLKAVADSGKEYKTFTRLPEGMDGSVKFIIKTAEVKADS